MMHMSFYNSNDLILLFRRMDSHSKPGVYSAMLIGIIFAGILCEWLGYIRFTYQVKSKKQFGAQMPSKYKLFVLASYFLQAVVAYALMLVVMSFNVGAFIAVVMGLSIGNFIFGF